MTLYLNTKRQYENYKELSQEKYFVDKSEIISIINENISTKSNSAYIFVHNCKLMMLHCIMYIVCGYSVQ